MMTANESRAAMAARRRASALDLRIGGASYRSIAQALQVSFRQAYLDVQRALAAETAVSLAKAEHAKTIELQRLDRVVFGLWPAVQQGDPDSVRAYIRAAERRAKILGLDAPVKVAPTNPDGTQAYIPPGLEAAHERVDELLRLALARAAAAGPVQVGTGQTEAAAAAEAAEGVV